MGPTVISAVLTAPCLAWHLCASLRDTEPWAGAARATLCTHSTGGAGAQAVRGQGLG